MELFPSDKQLHNDVLYEVYISDYMTSDIIQFYNNNFINRMKAFLIDFVQKNSKTTSSKRLMTPQIKSQIVAKSILESPLHTLLPPGVQNMKSSSLIKAGVMTPKTHLLFAFTESPLLKKDYKFGRLNIAKNLNNLNSKKLIDFDEANKEFANNENQRPELMKKKLTMRYDKDHLEEITENYNENIVDKNEKNENYFKSSTI